ncbi:MAG TPA: hypothetical protein VHU23_05495 [Rhizomicrobium sp.]|jgi:hypothetical protein|nr:hypothetical protein [Rhizomicrobium sp.]
MTIWARRVIVAALLGSSLLVPLMGSATEVKVISGLVGAQDSKSKELLGLTPDAADETATRDLLSVLKPAGKFTPDNSRNVESMVFITRPYQTPYPYVCREDRVTLQYKLASRFDTAGKWLNFNRQPAGVEAQPTYHVEQLPVPKFMPGIGYPAPVCDATHPGHEATWFAAPSDLDAVRATNMFRMAEDDVKSGLLTPEGCDQHGQDTCRQWILSLDDASKIESVKSCASSARNDACYVISFDAVDMAITGTIPANSFEPITPTSIESIRAQTVITLME